MTNSKVLTAVAALCMVLLAAGVFCGAAAADEDIDVYFPELQPDFTSIPAFNPEGTWEVPYDEIANVSDEIVNVSGRGGVKIGDKTPVLDEAETIHGEFNKALEIDGAAEIDDVVLELKAEQLKDAVDKAVSNVKDEENQYESKPDGFKPDAGFDDQLKAKLAGAKDAVDKAFSNVKDAVGNAVSNVKDQYADAKAEREGKLEVASIVRTGLNADTEREVINKLAAIAGLEDAETIKREVEAKREGADAKIEREGKLEGVNIVRKDAELAADLADVKHEIKLPEGKTAETIKRELGVGDAVAKAEFKYPESGRREEGQAVPVFDEGKYEGRDIRIEIEGIEVKVIKVEGDRIVDISLPKGEALAEIKLPESKLKPDVAKIDEASIKRELAKPEIKRPVDKLEREAKREGAERKVYGGGKKAEENQYDAKPNGFKADDVFDEGKYPEFGRLEEEQAVAGFDDQLKANGTVQFFNSEKGFGFIQPDAGEKDVFVHYSTL